MTMLGDEIDRRAVFPDELDATVVGFGSPSWDVAHVVVHERVRFEQCRAFSAWWSTVVVPNDDDDVHLLEMTVTDAGLASDYFELGRLLDPVWLPTTDD